MQSKFWILLLSAVIATSAAVLLGYRVHEVAQDADHPLG
jgi:hypothetical protein